MGKKTVFFVFEVPYDASLPREITVALTKFFTKKFNKDLFAKILFHKCIFSSNFRDRPNPKSAEKERPKIYSHTIMESLRKRWRNEAYNQRRPTAIQTS